MTAEWLAGAPYVAAGMLVVHLIARFINRCAEGSWRFNLGQPEWVLFHLMALPLLTLVWLICVALPADIGAGILKAAGR